MRSAAAIVGVALINVLTSVDIELLPGVAGVFTGVSKPTPVTFAAAVILTCAVSGAGVLGSPRTFGAICTNKPRQTGAAVVAGIPPVIAVADARAIAIIYAGAPCAGG